MSSIIDLIGQELYELSALEFENLPHLTVYTLPSTNIDQLVPNLDTMYMPIRSRMSWIMGQIKPELFALKFVKFAESEFVYTLASTNIKQSAPNLVKMYVTIRSRLNSIMDLIGPELYELFALEFAKMAESDFVYSLTSTNLNQLVPNMVTIYMIMGSWMSSIMG